MNSSRASDVTLEAPGVEVGYRKLGEGVRVWLKTTYPMPDETRYEVMLAMAEGQVRPHARPQVGSHSGFSNHVLPERVATVANQILRLARLDKKSARLERIYVPKQYVR